jgi:hypothetical protein
VYPPSEIFAKLVNKNAIKHQKDEPSTQNFYNPYIPSLPKFGKNLIDLPLEFQTVRIYGSDVLTLSHFWLLVGFRLG